MSQQPPPGYPHKTPKGYRSGSKPYRYVYPDGKGGWTSRPEERKPGTGQGKLWPTHQRTDKPQGAMFPPHQREIRERRERAEQEKHDLGVRRRRALRFETGQDIQINNPGDPWHAEVGEIAEIDAEGYIHMADTDGTTRKFDPIHVERYISEEMQEAKDRWSIGDEVVDYDGDRGTVAGFTQEGEVIIEGDRGGRWESSPDDLRHQEEEEEDIFEAYPQLGPVFQLFQDGLKLGPVELREVEWTNEYGDIKMSGRLIDPDTGNEVGQLIRNFHMGASESYVYHAYFTLEHSYRAKGAAKDLCLAQDEAYREAGLDYIKVTAALEVGRYAWALYGFDYAHDFNLDYHKGAIETELVDHNVDPATIEDLLDQIHHSWDVARFDYNGIRLGPNGYPIGKFVMLNGEGWDGKRSLDPDDYGYQVGQAYAKSKGKKGKGPLNKARRSRRLKMAGEDMWREEDLEELEQVHEEFASTRKSEPVDLGEGDALTKALAMEQGDLAVLGDGTLVVKAGATFREAQEGDLTKAKYKRKVPKPGGGFRYIYDRIRGKKKPLTGTKEEEEEKVQREIEERKKKRAEEKRRHGVGDAYRQHTEVGGKPRGAMGHLDRKSETTKSDVDPLDLLKSTPNQVSAVRIGSITYAMHDGYATAPDVRVPGLEPARREPESSPAPPDPLAGLYNPSGGGGVRVGPEGRLIRPDSGIFTLLPGGKD